MSEMNGTPCEKSSAPSPSKISKRNLPRPGSLMNKVYKCIKEHGPITTDRVVAICSDEVSTEVAIRRYEREKINRKWKLERTLDWKLAYGRKSVVTLVISNLKTAKKIKRLGELQYKKVSTWIVC